MSPPFTEGGNAYRPSPALGIEGRAWRVSVAALPLCLDCGHYHKSTVPSCVAGKEQEVMIDQDRLDLERAESEGMILRSTVELMGATFVALPRLSVPEDYTTGREVDTVRGRKA